MGSIRDVHNEFRDNLVPASFRGAVFHVESSSRASGRRTVVHQYPKRNQPYTEDMGREVVRWNFNGYLILRDKGIEGGFLRSIANLIGALEADEGGLLIHPTLGSMFVLCERYSYSDKRTAGGYVEFDMQFVEAGVAAVSVLADTVGILLQATTNASATASAAITAETKSLQTGQRSVG